MKLTYLKKSHSLINGLLSLLLLGLIQYGGGSPPVFAQADDYPRLIDIHINQNEIQGRDWPFGETVTLLVDDPSSAALPDYTGLATAQPAEDDPSVSVVEYDLGALILQPGFVMTMFDSSVSKTFTLVDLQVTSVDPAVDTVSGIAPAGVEVHVWTDGKSSNRYATANTNGDWSVDFTVTGTQPDEQTTYDILGDTSGHAEIDHGDSISTEIGWAAMAPYMQVNIDDMMFAAHNWPLGATITMSINGSDMGSILVENTPWGPFHTVAGFNYEYERRLQAGDIVSITDGTTPVTYTISTMQITHIDLDADTIEGIATPGDLVQVYSAGGFDGVISVGRWAPVDETGHWLADFHVPGVDPNGNPIDAILDIKAGSFGQAMDIDNTGYENAGRGNATWIDWWAPLVGPGAIYGTLFDEDGSNRLTGISLGVTATLQDGTEITNACSDPGSGDYQLANLPLDMPMIIFAGSDRCDPPQAWGGEYWREASEMRWATPITLVEDQPEIVQVDFTLPTELKFYELFTFNLGNPMLSELAVRQAIAYGTDRQQLLNEAFEPNGISGELMSSYVIPGYWALAPDSALTLYPYDPDLARSVLDAAGWLTGPDGVRVKGDRKLSIEFCIRDYQPRIAAAELFRLAMADIGIEVTIRIVPWEAYFNQLAQGEFEVAQFGWGDYHHFDDIVPPGYLESDSPSNYSGYNNPEADLLFDQAHAATSREAKLPYLIQHQALITQDLPVFPLFSRVPLEETDTTPPTLTWAGGIADGDSFYYGFVPAEPTCTAEDSGSGVDGECVVSGYATGMGTHTLSATAKDYAGNQAGETRSYSVLPWSLSGFYQPVDMNGVYNIVKNGRTVPLKFEIFAGPTELAETAYVKSFTYAQTSCDASATSDEVELTATGGTSLRYDLEAGQFIYNWKTPKSAGSCYRVTLTAYDGASLVAYFKLR